MNVSTISDVSAGLSGHDMNENSSFRLRISAPLPMRWFFYVRERPHVRGLTPGRVNPGRGRVPWAGLRRSVDMHAPRPNQRMLKMLRSKHDEAQLIHHYHSSAVLHLTCHADNSSSVAEVVFLRSRTPPRSRVNPR
eukprot:scaffold2884_cov141-Skeletonema_menzelii.AAC.12